MTTKNSQLTQQSHSNEQQSPFIICASGGKIVAQVCGEVLVADPQNTLGATSTHDTSSIIFKPVNVQYPTNTLLSNTTTLDGATLTYLNLRQPHDTHTPTLSTDGIDDHNSATPDTSLDIGISEHIHHWDDSPKNLNNSEPVNKLYNASVIKQDGSIVYTMQKETTNQESVSLEYNLSDFIAINNSVLTDTINSTKAYNVNGNEFAQLLSKVSHINSAEWATDESIPHLFDALLNSIQTHAADHI